MKICIVSRSISGDYSGSFEFDQAYALAEAGHEVYMLSLDLRSIRRRRKLGVHQVEYGSVKIVTVSIPLGAVNKKFFFSVAQKVFAKEMNHMISRYGDFDIIHAHFLDNAYIVSKSLDKLRSTAGIVVTEHTDITKVTGYGSNEFFKSVVSCAYGSADLLITVSKSLQKIILENYGFESVVVYNVVDTHRFEYDEKNKLKERRDMVFCSVGNLTENKRMGLLIDCFVKAFENKSEYKLYICGDGPEKNKLKEKIFRLGCQNNVYMLGKVSRERIAEIFAQTDAFVLLSRKETFGVAFVEAMVSGIPVLSTRSGGPEEFITEEVGILTEDDEETIIFDMKELALNREKYDGNMISEYAVNRFSPEVIARRLTDGYGSILS